MDIEPTLLTALVEYADAEDDISATFTATLPHQKCDASGKFECFDDDVAKADWSRAVKRRTLATEAVLSHARQVRAARGA